MMNKIRVVDRQKPTDVPCLIEVDEYVPLSFRTSREPQGSSFLRVGNYSTTLTEMLINPDTGLLRGVTLTSFERFSEWPALGETTPSEGLPVLSVDWGDSYSVDVERDFQVSLRGDQLLIWWDDVAAPSNSLTFGRVQFLVFESELRGIRFFDLSGEEVSTLAAHAQG